MRSNNFRPHWWQAYLSLPLLIVLFILDSRLKLTASLNESIQIGIVLLVYGLLFAWLNANESTFYHVDRKRHNVHVVIFPVVETDEDEYETIYQFPGSKSRNLLGDTLEMNYIEEELLPANLLEQEVSKE